MSSCFLTYFPAFLSWFKWKRPRLAVDVAMQQRLSMRFAPSCSSSFSCWSQPISDVGAHPPETKRSRTPCKGSFWAAKHAFCMTVLCCPWKGCPWEIQSYPNHAKLERYFLQTSCTPCKGSFWPAKHAFCMTVLCCLRKSCFSPKKHMPNFIR